MPDARLSLTKKGRSCVALVIIVVVAVEPQTRATVLAIANAGLDCVMSLGLINALIFLWDAKHCTLFVVSQDSLIDVTDAVLVTDLQVG